MSNEVSGPWAAFYEDGMGWDVPHLPPGHRAQLARLEAAEHAEQQRLDAERADRAETRFLNWQLRRQQELAWEGRPFDPSDWTTMVEPLEEFLARTYAAQDAEVRRSERRTLIEAGLLGVLPARFAGDETAAPDTGSSLSPVEAAPGASRGGTSSASPAPRSGPIAKVKELLHRGGVTPCCCPSCVAVRASRVES